MASNSLSASSTSEQATARRLHDSPSSRAVARQMVKPLQAAGTAHTLAVAQDCSRTVRASSRSSSAESCCRSAVRLGQNQRIAAQAINTPCNISTSRIGTQAGGELETDAGLQICQGPGHGQPLL